MKTILGLPPWAAMRSAVANANVPAAPAGRLRRDRCVWSDIGFLPNLETPKRRIPAGRDDRCIFVIIRDFAHPDRSSIVKGYRVVTAVWWGACRVMPLSGH